MTLATDIIASADAVSHAIFTQSDTGRFVTFEGTLEAERLNLIQARNNFANAGAAGTNALKAKIDAALPPVNAMTPTQASVNAAMAKVRSAADALGAALPATAAGMQNLTEVASVAVKPARKKSARPGKRATGKKKPSAG